jgi:hypothetical protein
MNCNFCLFFNFSIPKTCVFESFTWVIIHLDLVGFSFRNFKFKNDINYIEYKFSHRFGKVCRWLNMYNSKIIIIMFLEISTMSIWTFKKILYGFMGNVISTNIKTLNLEFTFIIVSLQMNSYCSKKHYNSK